MASTPGGANAADIGLGARVEINGTPGIVRYVGTTTFATGKWVGVELDEQNGKNDGSVQGRRYFDCSPGYGVFVRPTQIKKIIAPPPGAGSFTSSSIGAGGEFSPTRRARARSPSQASESSNTSASVRSRTGSITAGAGRASPATSSASSATKSRLGIKTASSPATASPTASSATRASSVTRTPTSRLSKDRGRADSPSKPSTPSTPTRRRSRSTSVEPSRAAGGTSTPSSSSSSSSSRRQTSTPPTEPSSAPGSGSVTPPNVDVDHQQQLPSQYSRTSSSSDLSSGSKQLETLQEEPASPLKTAAPSIPTKPTSAASTSSTSSTPAQSTQIPSTTRKLSITVETSKPPIHATSSLSTEHQQKQQASPTTEPESITITTHTQSPIPELSSDKASPSIPDGSEIDDHNALHTPPAPSSTPMPNGTTADRENQEENGDGKGLDGSPLTMKDLEADGIVDTVNANGEVVHADDSVRAGGDASKLTPLMSTNQGLNGSNQNLSAREIEDLKFKLRLLETKRANDRENSQLVDQLRTELASQSQINARLSDRLKEVQADLKDAKRAAREATIAKEALEAQVSEMNEALEMMTLDKEVAEERADALMAEVEALKDRVEEWKVDYEVLEQQAGIAKDAQEAALSGAAEQTNEAETVVDADADMGSRSSIAGVNTTNVQMLQLQRQNERLKEALVRLRDVTIDQEADMRARMDAMELEISELLELKTINERLQLELEAHELQIEELKMSLDDALGAEELIEQLTDKNLMLGERVEQMREAIEDLEALRDLNEEIEETHIETERQLQAEIDIKDSIIRELNRRAETQEESIADYERTITQFRELVRNLQSDIERLRQHQPPDMMRTGSDAPAPGKAGAAVAAVGVAVSGSADGLSQAAGGGLTGSTSSLATNATGTGAGVNSANGVGGASAPSLSASSSAVPAGGAANASVAGAPGAPATAVGPLSSQTQAMLSLNLQLQSTVMKARAKAVELDLRKLDVAQVTEHLELVKPFLPDSFFRNEHDSVLCMLLFRRVIFKAELVCGYIVEEGQNRVAANKAAKAAAQAQGGQEATGAVPGGDVHHVSREDLQRAAYTAELRQRLAWLAGLAKRFVAFMETSSVEAFLKMGKVYHDLAGTERRLNALVDLLKKEEIKGEHLLADLQRSIAQLEHLAETHLVNPSTSGGNGTPNGNVPNATAPTSGASTVATGGVAMTRTQSSASTTSAAGSTPAASPQQQQQATLQAQQVALVSSFTEGLECCAERVDAELTKLKHVFVVHEDDHVHHAVVLGAGGAGGGSAATTVAELQQMQQGLDVSAGEGLNGLADDVAIRDELSRVGSEFLRSLPDVLAKNRSFKVQTKKLIRRVSEMSEQSMVLRVDLVAQLREMHRNAMKAVDYCSGLASQVRSHVKNKLENKQPLSAQALFSLSSTASEQFLGVSETASGGEAPESAPGAGGAKEITGMGSGVYGILEKLGEGVAKVLEAAEDGKNVEKVVKGQSPWLSRADAVKSEYAVNVEMQKQIESLNEEILSLIKDIKLKEQQMQEAAVKIELLEKRGQDVRKHADVISQLEDELARSRQQEKLYEDAIESLHADLEQMEQENEKLKKMSKRFEQKGGVGSPSPLRRNLPDDDAHIGSPATMGIHSPIIGMMGAGPTGSAMGSANELHESVELILDGKLASQFESLKAAVRYLRAENSRLKAARMYLSASKLFHPSDPLMRKAHKTAVRLTQPEQERTLASVALEAKLLVREVHALGAMPKVVDLSKALPATDKKWQSMKNDPLYQKAIGEAGLERLVKREADLREKVVRISVERHNALGGKAVHVGGGSGPKKTSSDAATSKTPSQQLPQTLQKQAMIGRVRIPALPQLRTAISNGVNSKEDGTTAPEDIGLGAGHVDPDARRHCVTFSTRQEFESLHAIFAT
ncbi:hypothetical protein HK102_000645 [Quaeritorhiza haematococci]|nr:hypothetical protein HK102_000645 [Quaeritorhiza haematococci]